MEKHPLKLVYCTPALYMAGGVERVLTLKANYFAEHFGYDITIILTEGKDKPLFYPLSDKIKVVHLDINFEELWTCSFIKKIFVYLKKQRIYKQKLTAELMRIRPDISVSLLRREINFINGIKDGSKKVGELHINRANYRNFNTEKVGFLKRLFAKIWSHNLVSHLEKLDRLVVLTDKDREAWTELSNVVTIPDPLPFVPISVSSLSAKRVVAIARYSHEKGIDLLLEAWSKVEKIQKEWRLDVFGDGERTIYEQMIGNLEIDQQRCQLHGRTNDVEYEYSQSSLFVLSSRFEGFGLVIIEAMSCGLPVLAFDCPWGPTEIITDGKDGLLVDNGNVSQLADSIIYLIDHPDVRKQMAEQAKRKSENYKIDNLAIVWKDLLEEL